MEDSAMIDGATYWTVLVRIIAPLAKPVIAVVALFSAVQHWNSWFDALIYAPHPRLTVLQMLVFRMLNDIRSDWFLEYQEMMRQAGIDVEMFAAEAVQAATIVLTIGPIILVYPFLQRFFVKGVMLGSLKG
jgi:putative aldouronate transport system permease protein